MDRCCMKTESVHVLSQAHNTTQHNPSNTQTYINADGCLQNRQAPFLESQAFAYNTNKCSLVPINTCPYTSNASNR